MMAAMILVIFPNPGKHGNSFAYQSILLLQVLEHFTCLKQNSSKHAIGTLAWYQFSPGEVIWQEYFKLWVPDCDPWHYVRSFLSCRSINILILYILVLFCYLTLHSYPEHSLPCYYAFLFTIHVLSYCPTLHDPKHLLPHHTIHKYLQSDVTWPTCPAKKLEHWC